jgi:molybdate transport system substrate-binding protein
MALVSFSWCRLPLLLLAATVGVSGVARSDEITLAAGAGFRRPISEIAVAFEKEKGHKIAQIYGHMGQVLAQARDSGKVAIVCGDRSVLDGAKGLTFGGFAKLGLGKLVVAYRKGLTLTQPEDIQKPEFKRVGIPDQANAIYGKAGRQFLERASLAKAIDPKLLAVATVPQVTSYLVSGEIDAGFVNATDAIGAAGNIGGFVEVDQKLYDPVEVSCGIVAASATGPAVADFMTFLNTAAARAILTRYGL